MNLRELTQNKLFVSLCFGALVAVEAWSLDRIISLSVQFGAVIENIFVPLIATVIAFVLVDLIRQMQTSRKKRALLALMLVVVSFVVAASYTLLKLHWAKMQLTGSL